MIARTAARGFDGGVVAGTRLVNVPNAVTLVRTVVAMGLALPAIVLESVWLAVAAYLVYWVGDVLDGMTARWLGQETRAGAVFDIVSDRACTSLCAAALLVLLPEMALPVGIFLVQFMVVDCMLSLSFLFWTIRGPNYFHEVHRGVYRWNWSPPAKALNTSGLVVLVLLSPTPLWPALFAGAAMVVKVASLVAVGRLVAVESARA
ncbi:hypothetical protein GCM10009853_012350 [Glycomyces scopariae]|uniref:CDP-diacylglycerol--glycerol-3-phosphate 3-phosphatidyltransferase n=1 Tax=Glycomyces sambucus TaxID=380244 RepID=A0A1G9MND4_9ACTN|nr:CDP-alcohol phosphatidyltransferase family protein [Glycomyces sambucus]SDL75531.1 CDP-diacylglycerol--glycerol-3-phosphate 3-phosphatidyltransferase [Glycomyces sambucus]